MPALSERHKMKNFEGFGLSKVLNTSLSKMNYTAPTPIQEKAIPIALKGRDILGSAQTGTGKTAAFAIPMIESLLRSPKGSALIMTPTRELAKQVLDVVHQLTGPKSGLKTAFIIGGEPMGKQLSQLRARPRIIVGTPGRINDHLRRQSIDLDNTGFLVLDETDRMLDMGFGEQLDTIIKYLPEERQTLMFSATLPQAIIKLAAQYLNKPQRVSVGETNVVALNIKQEIIKIEHDKKYAELLNQLHERQGSVIIFAKTKHSADKMAIKLRKDGFTSEALHGDLRQNKRDRVMKNFRQRNFRILVATDIAARGLDVPHIEHVINYDLPQVAEDYIHRMGRTARAGAEGSALCFISPQDGRKWHAIECLLDPGKTKSSQRDKPRSKGRRPTSKGKPYHGRPAKKDSRDKKQFSNNKSKFENDNSNKQEKRSEDFKAKRKPRRDRVAQGKDFEQSGDAPYKKKSAKPSNKSFNKSTPKSHKPSKDGFKSGGKRPKPHGKNHAGSKKRFNSKPKQRAA